VSLGLYISLSIIISAKAYQSPASHRISNRICHYLTSTTSNSIASTSGLVYHPYPRL
jgi:hypothetical protein